MTSIITLALAYAFLLLLLILALFKSELPVLIKAVTVVLASVFYVWHYDALLTYRGWPTEESLPQQFEMLSRVVVEPDLARDQEGGVYLWLRDLQQQKIIPRAYRLPYSRDLHQAVEDSLRGQQRGERFIGRPANNAGGGGGSAITFERLMPERPNQKPGSSP